jgi:DNA invertase Pin-like site-specific DNA recombinase
VPQLPASASRALLYGRVSVDARDGASVDQQLVEGRKVAKREGWRIVGEYRDDGISASRYARGRARPGWRAVMDEITAGRVDLLVVWEVSRATRDRTVWSALLAACTEAGVGIAVGGRVHDPTDPDDSFVLDLTAALAVRESGVTSKRIRRDVAARADAGQPHGRLPYGYARTYDATTGKLAEQVEDPETGPVVREIVNRVLVGEALYTIAADLNRRNVPSPLTVTRRRNMRPTVDMPWRPDQVRRVAASPTNAGLRVHQGEVKAGVEATWTPIVARADHAAVVEMFTDPARKTNLAGASTAAHLLVGIAVCGVCGATVRRIKNRGVPSYACPRGFHVARAIHFVDGFIEDVLLARLGRPDAADLFAADDDDETAARETARGELADLRARLTDWRKAAVKGRVTPESLAVIEDGLAAEIADAERRARPRPSSPVLRDVLDGGTGAVRERWAELPVPARREVVRTLMEIKIHRTRRGARHLDPESVEIKWRGAE